MSSLDARRTWHAPARSPRSTSFVQVGGRGACLDLLWPDWSPITISDIAWSLARLPRFLGHTQARHPYSVAEHSVYVAAEVMGQTGDRLLAAGALLHDAHECAMGDIPTPVKIALGRDRVSALEERLQAALAQRFGLSPALLHHPAVRRADQAALATEQRDLLAPAVWPWAPAEAPWPQRIVPVPAAQAYARFLGMAAQLGVGA